MHISCHHYHQIYDYKSQIVNGGTNFCVKHIYPRGQQTMAHEPYLAYSLFLYGLSAKDVFYVLIWLKKTKRKISVTFKSDMKF